MKARDVMVSPVITVKPSTSVRELAETLVKQRISAVPVVDERGQLVGIVSEGDLLHRVGDRF
jgi:CBS domain-containing protein